MKGNLDLQTAETRIMAARAQRSITDALRWPSVNAFSAYQRQRISPNALLGTLGSTFQGGSQNNNTNSSLPNLNAIGTPFNLFRAGLMRRGNWISSAVSGVSSKRLKLMLKLLKKVGEIYKLSAEVARQYLELISLQRHLEIAADRLKNQQELYRFVYHAYQEGMTNVLDLERAKTELQAVQGNLRRSQHKSKILTMR